MSKLDVSVALTSRDDGFGQRSLLTVTARNRTGDEVVLVGCVLLPPLGLRLSPETPVLAYPHRLPPAHSCSEEFDCVPLANKLRGLGYSGAVRLVAVFLEAGGRVIAGLKGPAVRIDPEHRSDPFFLNLSRYAAQ